MRCGSIVADRGEPWRVVDGLILHGNRLFVSASSAVLHEVLHLAHAGHEGIQRTLQRLRTDFFVDQDRGLVRDFVRSCTTCQRHKTEALHPAGLLSH